MQTTSNLGLKKPGSTDVVDIDDFNSNADTLDGKFGASTGHGHTGAVGDGPKIGSSGLAAGAATDAVIGSRTVSDATAPTGDSGTPTTLFGWLANMIKAITGGATWRTLPGMTIAAIKTILDAATNAATASTMVKRDASGRAQVAAPSAAADIARKDTVDGAISTHTAAADPHTQYVLVAGDTMTGPLTAPNVPNQTTGDLTYYVRTDGSDSNAGTTNTAGGAFKTIGKAISMIPQIVNHAVTINIGTGTYPETVSVKGFSGKGGLNIAAGSGASVLNVVAENNAVPLTVSGITCTTTTTHAFYLAHNVWVYVNGCTATSAAPSWIGAYAYSSSVIIAYSIFSNKQVAIQSGSGSRVYSYNNSGTGNSTGLYAAEASYIGGEATTISGTTASYSNTGGMISIGFGVINPWGDNTTSQRSYVGVFHGSNQTVLAATWTKVGFANEAADVLGEWDGLRFTASKTGIYLFSLNLHFLSLSAGANIIGRFYLNGYADNCPANAITSAGNQSISANHAFYMSAGDYVECYAYCSQATSLISDGNYTNLQVTRLA